MVQKSAAASKPEAEPGKAKRPDEFTDYSLLPIEGARALAMAGAATFKGATEFNGELIAFTDKWLRNVQDNKALGKRNGDLVHMMQAYNEATLSATKAWFEESCRLMELSAQTAQEAWAPLGEFYTGALSRASNGGGRRG